jgi:hypothetical protein
MLNFINYFFLFFHLSFFGLIYHKLLDLKIYFFSKEYNFNY